MTAPAVKVLAVLNDEGLTETEIAQATGLRLIDVRTALDELDLTGEVLELTDSGLRVYAIARADV